MSANDWNKQVIDEFRANGGRVGGPFEGRTLLLLHHRGSKTGTDGAAFYLVQSDQLLHD